MPAASAISRTVVAATPCRANSSAASRRMTSRRSSGWATRTPLRVDGVSRIIIRSYQALATSPGGRVAARTLPAVVAEAAAERPEGEALVFRDVRLTFAELQREVQRFAAAALAAGVRPGDRTAIWAPNSDRWVVAALGLTSVGAVLVPVNTRVKGEEARHVLATTRASLLFVDNAFLDVDRAAMLAAEEPLPDLHAVVALDDDAWHRFLASGAQVTSGAVAAAAAAVAPTDISDIIFTSGTTGRPKGAMVTHE